jgi:hypothetical protein
VTQIIWMRRTGEQWHWRDLRTPDRAVKVMTACGLELSDPARLEYLLPPRRPTDVCADCSGRTIGYIGGPLGGLVEPKRGSLDADLRTATYSPGRNTNFADYPLAEIDVETVYIYDPGASA